MGGTKINTCRICDNDENNRLFTVRETMFGTGDCFTYFQCSKCKCLQIQEFPKDLSKYYSSDYYSFESSSQYFKNPIERLARRLRDKYAVLNRGIIGKLLYNYFPNESLRSLSKLKLTKFTKILDVGCGAGFLLYSLTELGFNKLLGIDPYIEEDITYENGLKIVKSSIYKLKGEWDIIMFHHSFEHLTDPLETLLHVSKLLSEYGVCLIRIPTVSSYAWEHYGTDWVQLDAPRHLFLYSIESFQILAEKSNMELYYIYYDSNEFQFWGSEQNRKGIAHLSEISYRINPSKSFFSRSDIYKFREKAKKLNLENKGDQVALYLKKSKKI